MLNIHLIYVSSLETGDVEISRKVYTSFIGAVEDIDNVIQKYITDRKVSSYQILSKEDFDSKKLIKDATFLEGGYCFRKKKSNVNIYKKVIIEGRLWNGGYKLDKVGKIGILSEISIPIDDKLLPLINSKVGSDNSESKIERTENIQRETIVLSQPVPGNYQHGQHVSFIQELKDKLQKRRNSIMNVESPKKLETPKNNFVNSLTEGKNNLKHITPPSSPNFGLGRVISEYEINNSDESISWDSDSFDNRRSLDYEADFHENILYEQPIYSTEFDL